MQKQQKPLDRLKAQVVVVFREDELGVQGLQKVRQATGTPFTLAADLGAKQTPAYKPFATYLIDDQGILRAVLTGTKIERPGAAEILAALQKFAEKSPE